MTGSPRSPAEPFAVGVRCLLVSAHLDDAVLSAGGLLAALRSRAVVLTLFAGEAAPPYSPFAADLHVRCGLGVDPVAARRAEDRAALSMLGVTAVHAGLLDAVYRRGPDGRWLYPAESSIFGPRQAGDAGLLDRAAALVRAACRRARPDVLLGPAAAGGHVDHVLTRDAVRVAGRRCGLPVWLWEDQPYLLEDPLAVVGAPECEPVVVPVAPADWARRIAATARYASQLAMLFPAPADWSRELTGYAGTVTGDGQPAERYWPQ